MTPLLSRLTALLAISLGASCLANDSAMTDAHSPISSADSTISPETEALLRNLHRIGWDPDKIMFGQEFPLSYSRSMTGITDATTSDVKDVVGDHPGVHGSDFHFLIDKDPHERVAHKIAAKAAYDAGALVTFDYHWLGKYGGTHEWHKRDAEILYNVVRDDDSAGDVTWFYHSLDQVLKVVNEDLQFPIVFRPFHEMNGKWFWWGSKLKGGPETYKQAYRILVDYLSERTEYMLFSWSPDKALALDCYPGDDYVDIIGLDGYGQGNEHVPWYTVEQMVDLLEQMTDFAAERGKVVALTETGYDTQGDIAYHTEQPDWWTRSVLEPILASEKARRIAWVLTWINSDWSGPYAPTANSPQASQEAFRAFHAHPVTLFQNEVAQENLYR
ncbi:glycosyl hydrolase [Pelagicoccus sp. SDUM812003]|uniref:glycoside hydrolase family 26 protein n=1 Tax=Pelagicoccus sp. SDUM812003 TaxID=3041267 RepID=UPI00280DDED8|nr:glycosyl hydrolase [Pelagicoccus sp. SDUM812003]MDQ8204965.1 glycosyl hydrolase [Pelagicoccus sp. SDUM812003]